jgi:hypothetical protein
MAIITGGQLQAKSNYPIPNITPIIKFTILNNGIGYEGVGLSGYPDKTNFRRW